MPRKAPIPKCPEQDKKMLEQLAGSRTEEARLVERAKIILKCLQGERVHEIAKEYTWTQVWVDFLPCSRFRATSDASRLNPF